MVKQRVGGTPSHTSQAAWALHGIDASDQHLAERLLAPETLVHAWLHHADADPHRVALIAATGSLTYGQLQAAVGATQQTLGALGVAAGQRVLVSCQPSIELVVLHVALLATGAIVVPVNTGFTRHEVDNIATEAAVAIAVLDDATRCGVVADRYDVSLVPFGTTAGAHTEPVRGAEASAPTHIHASVRRDGGALLLFTSGTTGRPKGALLTHGNLLASAAALVAAWGWTSDDRLILNLPLFHMHGLGVGVHGTLLAGASAVVQPSFHEDAVFDAIEAHRATLLFGVPTMWTRLLAHQRVGELRPLRLCVSGSAPLSPEVWLGLESASGQQVVERYGMTETVMLTSNPLHGARKPGSVGVALPGVEVELHQQGEDGVGEIIVRGPNVFHGYLDRPDANADAFVEGGWFRTGDLGRFDGDGYLHIVGRSKDLIITGGYNVYPSDVEAVMREHAAVAEVAVIGEPSPLWGETVTACVVLRPDAGSSCSEQDLIDHGASRLAPYQRPRRVLIVDTLPRNALGKVLKAELKATAAAMTAAMAAPE